jgi:hypothetical protein
LEKLILKKTEKKGKKSVARPLQNLIEKDPYKKEDTLITQAEQTIYNNNNIH